MRDETKIVIHYDPVEGKITVHEVIDLLGYIYHHRYNEEDHQGVYKGTYELAQYIPIYFSYHMAAK